MLLIPDAPFFNGYALGQYFDPNIRGIWIPEDYFKAREITSPHEGLILLWPSVTTYVQTSWGYQGTNRFYNSFFSPTKVITQDFFGGYALYNPYKRDIYVSLSRPPIRPVLSSDITNIISEEKILVWGAKYERSDYSINLFINGSDHVDIVFPFAQTMNISNYQFLIIEFSLNPLSYIEDLARSNNVWIGISDTKYVGWYIFGSSSNIYSIHEEDISVAMLIGFPDKPWASSMYDAGLVTGVIIRLITRNFANPVESNFSLKSIKIAFSDADLSIINAWKQFGVKYVLFDKSIVGGAMSAVEPYNLSVSILMKEGILSPILTGRNIELYEVNYKYGD
jgi:hypothetical protein